jgi:dUTPase
VVLRYHLVTWLKALEVLFVADRVPTYSHPGDAGADLTAAVAVQLAPGGGNRGDRVVDCAPDGYGIRGRAASPPKHGITIVNSPGTVDAATAGRSASLSPWDGQLRAVLSRLAIGSAQLVVTAGDPGAIHPRGDSPRQTSAGVRFWIDRYAAIDSESPHDDQQGGSCERQHFAVRRDPAENEHRG